MFFKKSCILYQTRRDFRVEMFSRGFYVALAFGHSFNYTFIVMLSPSMYFELVSGTKSFSVLVRAFKSPAKTMKAFDWKKEMSLSKSGKISESK